MIWTDEGYLVKLINYSENSIIAIFLQIIMVIIVELSMVEIQKNIKINCKLEINYTYITSQKLRTP